VIIGDPQNQIHPEYTFIQIVHPRRIQGQDHTNYSLPQRAGIVMGVVICLQSGRYRLFPKGASGILTKKHTSRCHLQEPPLVRPPPSAPILPDASSWRVVSSVLSTRVNASGPSPVSKSFRGLLELQELTSSAINTMAPT
jgi:hypothetical protein